MANPTPPSPTALTPNISKLRAIKNKIRRITRSPSTSQLPEFDLNDYINTFVIYDFPRNKSGHLIFLQLIVSIQLPDKIYIQQI